MKYISQTNITQSVLRRASDSEEKNSIFSPTCNVAFFHLLRELVDPSTKSFFERSFDFDLQHMESFLKSINRTDKKLAFKIFQIKNYSLEKETETSVREKFNSEIESVDDQNPLELEKSIEEWLKTYTNDIFSNLIKGPSVNRATSYNVNWAKIFDKSKTTNEKFQHSISDSTDVEMMNISGKFKYFEDEELNAKIIELPCVNKAGIRSKDISVLIYLPNNSQLIDYLPPENKLKELIEKMENVDVDVSIPKFKAKTECDIIDFPGNFMMYSDNLKYALTKFTNSNSYISKIITQGFMEVNEDNILTVATTGCDMCFQPILKEMVIECEVTNRFAKTLLTNKFFNANIRAQETTFSVILPENAFITEFEMVIEGKSYKSYVKEKEQAKKTYDEAVASGRSAAHVAVSARDSNKFTVSVNVAPKSDAQFLLTYEELLERKLDQYELILNIHPGQLLEKLNVKVNIEESSKIRFVKIPPIRSGNEITENETEKPPQTTVEIDDAKALIQFNPDRETQRQIAYALKKPEHEGISGQFVIQYDVDMNKEGGEVLLRDGYFVHFYVPDDLPALPKHVVFALDTSGSMSGRKIQQLRDAMTYILDQIMPQDLISLLDFKHKVIVHNVENQTSVSVKFDYQENYLECMHKFEKIGLPQPKQASKEILNSAKEVAKGLRADGSTHMIGALEVSLYLVNRSRDEWKNHQPIIVFLTDGEPTDGVDNPDQITDIITRLNMDSRVPIFTLSFGEEADKDFLRKLSLKNFAFSRHIYEAADASLQLQQFYKQISSPVMSNVTFKYEDNVEDITRVNFPIYFRGCDLVICGRYEVPDHLGVVRCHRNGLDVLLNPRIKDSIGPLERFWAFLTVKQILEKSKYSEDRQNLRKKAMDLALKYSFVTEVTSLVVVKPEENAQVDPENAAIPRERQPMYRGPNTRNFRSMCAPMSIQLQSGLMTVQRQLCAAQPLSAVLSTAPVMKLDQDMLFSQCSGSPSTQNALSDDNYHSMSPRSASSGQSTLFGGSGYMQSSGQPTLFGGSGPDYMKCSGRQLSSRGGPASGWYCNQRGFIDDEHQPSKIKTKLSSLCKSVARLGNYQLRVPLKKNKKDEKKDSGPKQFKADKPFIIILQSKFQDEIVALFIGKITKPVY